MVSIVNESIFPCKLTSTTSVPVLPSFPHPLENKQQQTFSGRFYTTHIYTLGKKDEQKVEQGSLPKKISNT